MENIIRNNIPQGGFQQPEIIQQEAPQVDLSQIFPETQQAQPAQPIEVQQPQSLISDVSNQGEPDVSQINEFMPDETGRTWKDYLKEDGFFGKDEQSKAVERRKEIEKQTKDTPIFEKAMEGAKWVGETAKNTLVDRPINLLTGVSELGYQFGIKPLMDYIKGDTEIDKEHPIIKSLTAGFKNVGEFTGLDDYIQKRRNQLEANPELADKMQVIQDIGADIANNFIVKPITGQTVPEMYYDPNGIWDRLTDHIHEGGMLDAYLTLLPTPAGKVINKGISTGVKATGKETLNALERMDNKLTGGKNANLIEDVRNYGKVKELRDQLRAESVYDKIALSKEGVQWKKDLLDTYDRAKISRKDFETIIEHAEDLDRGLDTLSPELKVKYNALKPLLVQYDNMVQKYVTATPGNLQEIYQSLVRGSQRTGKNLSYQVVKDMFEDSGLLELGRFIDRNTGKVIRQDNVLKTLSKDGSGVEVGIDDAGNLTKLDLRNTDFVIPEENLKILAQLALNDPLAQHLFKAYGAVRAGKLQRVSHGLAPVDKSVKINRRGKINKENPFASERVYGNSTYEDIASQWLEPDNLFRYALEGAMQQNVLNAWKKQFLTEGKAITLKNSRPEDIIYVPEDSLYNANKLEGIINKASKELPKEGDYIAIDKNLLKAYRDLFGARKQGVRIPGWMRDLVTLYKRKLLLGGTYLGGNLLGGLHQMLTNSNLHIIEDVMSAMRTRGELIRSLGIQRELPAKGDIRLSSDLNTPYGKFIRNLHEGANIVGGRYMNAADAFMQNKFAEVAAHDILRKKGIPFNKRNLEWMKQNMSKTEFYKTLRDIQLEALIYGDETLIPKQLLDLVSLGNPFIRWLDQATESSIYSIRRNPTVYGYLQGAVLGGLAWSQNKANAQGFGISNPQSGKIYHIDPKTGDTKNADVTVTPDLKSVKVSEYGAIPYLTTAKAIQDPIGIYGKNVPGLAPAGWLLQLYSNKTPYGTLKERSKWGKDWKGDTILPDYQRNVRIKNGVVTDSQELDEIGNQFLSETVFASANNIAAPIVSNLLGQPSYKPYSNQMLSTPGGNPNKKNNTDDLINRLIVRYDHPAYEGTDYEIGKKKESSLTRSVNKRTAKKERTKKEDVLAREKRKLKGGE